MQCHSVATSESQAAGGLDAIWLHIICDLITIIIFFYFIFISFGFLSSRLALLLLGRDKNKLELRPL